MFSNLNSKQEAELILSEIEGVYESLLKLRKLGPAIEQAAVGAGVDLRTMVVRGLVGRRDPEASEIRSAAVKAAIADVLEQSPRRAALLKQVIEMTDTVPDLGSSGAQPLLDEIWRISFRHDNARTAIDDAQLEQLESDADPVAQSRRFVNALVTDPVALLDLVTPQNSQQLNETLSRLPEGWLDALLSGTHTGPVLLAIRSGGLPSAANGLAQ